MAPSELLVAQGPRAAEDLLWQEVARRLTAAPELLARPLRVVVPSRSLRLHLGRALTRRHGRPLVGLEIETLHGLALAIGARAGLEPPRGAAAHELLVRRRARDEELLRASFDHLDDGYAAVAASVRDLLDAGLGPAHADALLELLDSVDEGQLAPPVVARARALIRVAAAVGDDAEALGVARAASILGRAAELVATDPERFLPARWVAVHGFADVTGVAGDLLEAVVRALPSTVIVDCPADAAGGDPPSSFAERFLARLAPVTGAARAALPTTTPATLTVLAAPERESEVRAVLELVAADLAAATPAAAIGVVARQPAAYASALRRHADRLGLPLAAVGETVPGGAAARRLAAVATLLEHGASCRVEAWVEAVGLPLAVAATAVLALHRAGASRVGEVAAARPAPLLPITAGFAADGRRRQLPLDQEMIAALGARAAATVDALAAWPASAPAAAHLAHTRAVLGPAADDAAGRLVERLLRRLADDLPAAWPIDRDEWLLLLRRGLERGAGEPLAGSGGGVRVLSVMEARGLCFERLYLLGLNRDVFPRQVHEDPLLPDAVRGRLAAVLPDIPIKQRGWDEERHLFAALLAAAPVVTLSRATDDGGTVLAASPFLVRLGLEPTPAAGLWQRERAGRQPRPAFEHAVLAGLAGDRAAWRAALAAALAEAARRWPGAAAPAAAAARRDLLDLLDPELASAGLGPFTGMVGVTRPDDPRRRRPAVTALEAVARCPWQGFVRRLLAVEPELDPVVELPDATPAMVGSTVHGVLQGIVDDALGDRPEGSDQALPAPWPAPAELARRLAAVAARVAADHGCGRSGVDRLLAVRALPHLLAARAADWSGGPPTVVGAETWVSTELAPDLAVACRVDRVDRVGDELVLTDYKTGAAIGAKKLATEVAAGRALQAAAYAFSHADAARVRGRYLYLSGAADADPPFAATELASDDRALHAAFVAAATTVVAAWEIGALPPRVALGAKKDNPACSSCEVRAACFAADSGFRRRMLAWRDAVPDGSELDRVARALWWLGCEEGR